MSANLKQQTATAFIWSAIQNWGMKLFTILVFLILARYLSPAELGLASTVTLVLAFVAVISEQGFTGAIVQRKNLQPKDLNLPFIISIGTSLLASCLLIIFSKEIAHQLRADDAASLIKLAAIIPPITAAINFESAMRKRALDFQGLAKASLLSGVLAGIIAIALAANNFGALSLVVQAIATAAIIGVVLLRSRIWHPVKGISTENFRSLFSYSSNVFVSKLLDFFSGRIIEFIIIGKFGIAAFGLYTVGSKLYLTVRQLLCDVLYDVSFSAMSRISIEIDRFRQVYLRFIFLASCTTIALFTLMAALASELCSLLFGEKWVGVDQVMQWLCLSGAIEVVHYFNYAALSASGKSRAILYLTVIKLVSGIAAMMLSNAESISEITLYFVISQIACFPISLLYAMKATKSKGVDVLRQMTPGLIATFDAWCAVLIVRPTIEAMHSGLLPSMIMLGFIFVCVFLFILWLGCSKRLVVEFRYILSAYTRK